MSRLAALRHFPFALPAAAVLSVSTALAAVPLTTAGAVTGPPAGTAVAGWGSDSSGQLGNGTASDTPALSPVLASLPPGTRLTAIAVGCDHALAVTSTGTVLAWGSNSAGELGTGAKSPFSATPVTVKLPAGVTASAVSGGCGYSLAVTTTGQVYAWGDNSLGQLGNGATGAASATPALAHLPAGTTVRSVAAGRKHALAVTTRGQVLAWGANDVGQLGNGRTGAPNGTPAAVPLPAGTQVTTATAGVDDSLVATVTGQVFGWGSEFAGGLGDGRTNGVAASPVRTLIPAGLRVRSLFAGCSHTLATTATGLVLAWGDSGNGQLGTGSSHQDGSAVPVHVPLAGAAVAVGGGCVHSTALTRRGQVFSWGAATLQGNGTSAENDRPEQVSLPGGRTAIAIGGAAVADFSLALLR
jgi:alpha-tubulin suppressor-like RCC1 family protein